jgi:hypothetical protein
MNGSAKRNRNRNRRVDVRPAAPILSVAYGNRQPESIGFLRVRGIVFTAISSPWGKEMAFLLGIHGKQDDKSVRMLLLQDITIHIK